MNEPAMKEAQERSQMWGASLFSYPHRDGGEWLRLLALEGIRAWVAPARAGRSGYLALIIHPDDAAAGFQAGPTLSGGRPSIERWVAGERLRLSPFASSDFAPMAESVQDNVERARAAALARQEQEELERLAGAGRSSSRSGRL